MSGPSMREIKAAADRIREVEAPIDYSQKGKALDAEIRAQNEAIRRQLEAWGLTWSTTNQFGTTVEGRHVWHTAIIQTDAEDNIERASGRWSDNPVECELHLRMYSECSEVPAGGMTVLEDADGEISDAIKQRNKERERQRKAIAKKIERTRARYTDETDWTQAEPAAGMMF